MKLDAETASRIAASLQYKTNGLVAVVAQNAKSQRVLMVAYANRDAVEKTLTTGYMHYWSRERQKLWKKGEESGHIQILKRLHVDCDADALLAEVEQVGGACHEGYESCFYRRLEGASFQIVDRSQAPRD